MTLADLLVACREGLDDEIAPYLYPDESLVRWINAAVREACLRTRGLQDDSSDACSVTLVPGQARYELDTKILVVRAVHVPGRRHPVDLVKASTLDRLAPGWSHETQQPGVPRWTVFDVGQKTITLQPPPAVAGMMKLRAWRLPFEEEEFAVGDDDSEPALALANPESLKHWVLYEAFSKKDSELYDPERAGTAYQIFEVTYGPRPSDHDLMLWSTSRIVGVRVQKDF